MIPGYVDFEFDLPGALLARLIQVLDTLTPAPLNAECLAVLPDAQGVYQLFLDGNLVYIGKTDAEAGLRKRLDRHRLKIQHRRGLDASRVAFKAVRIYVFTAIDLETQLIDHYGGLSAVGWNGSGFGSNDPGRERDTTRYRPNHFDARFPIDIEQPLALELPSRDTAANILSVLKTALPYILRYEGVGPRSRSPHSDLRNTMVSTLLISPATAKSVIEVVVSQLPTGWQATYLLSHIILYKETKDYSQGYIIARSSSPGL
jgi:hypothetical protein